MIEAYLVDLIMRKQINGTIDSVDGYFENENSKVREDETNVLKALNSWIDSVKKC